jgi:hypothetical protein
MEAFPSLFQWEALPEQGTHAFLAIKYSDVESDKIDVHGIIPPYADGDEIDPYLVTGTIMMPGQDEYFIYVDAEHRVASVRSRLTSRHPSAAPNLIHTELTPGTPLPPILLDYIRSRIAAEEEDRPDRDCD